MNAQEALVNIGYSTTEARKILPSLFLYLFRAFKQSELYRRAEAINPKVDLFKLLPRIPLMGEITLHDKVCIFALYQGENPGIKPNAYIKTAVLSNPEVCEWLSQYKDFPAYNLATVRALESRALANSEITTYIGKFINRKMRFIMDYYGVEFEELCEALQERAIHNLRVNYPNWNSSGEMIAMSKSAIANAGQNLLKYYSATKRAKVDKNNKAVEYSLEGMFESGDSPEYQALVYSDSLDRGMEVLEATMSVSSLVNSLHSKPHAKLLIELLSGKYHVGFSNFLNRDCSEYAEEATFEKLLTKACAYMGVDLDDAMPYLQKLTLPKGKKMYHVPESRQ